MPSRVVMPNASGMAISLHASDDIRDRSGYVVAGVPWAGRYGVWPERSDGPHASVPTPPKTDVRLGIMDAEVEAEGIGGTRVVASRCLEQTS
jgi:hypothetical protein